LGLLFFSQRMTVGALPSSPFSLMTAGTVLLTYLYSLFLWLRGSPDFESRSRRRVLKVIGHEIMGRIFAPSSPTVFSSSPDLLSLCLVFYLFFLSDFGVLVVCPPPFARISSYSAGILIPVGFRLEAPSFRLFFPVVPHAGCGFYVSSSIFDVKGTGACVHAYFLFCSFAVPFACLGGLPPFADLLSLAFFVSPGMEGFSPFSLVCRC